MNNYPNNYERPPENGPDYASGYQSQPSQQPVYPPNQYPPPSYPLPQQMPAPGLAYPQQMAYPQGGYPQQQMMPPQQINLMVSNVNNNVAMAGVGGMVKRHPPTIIRIIYFLCIGLYLGMFWLSMALFFCCTIVGIPLGLMMLRQVPTIMLL